MKREQEGSEPAAGSAVCTNRGGVRVSLSLAGALPAPWAPARTPPSLLFPPPFSPSSLSFLLLSPSPSEVAPSAGREKGDSRSHTLAPATTSEVPTSLPVPFPHSWVLRG
uniref:Uncharacterized protein n=1 Tax=Urocitellus parryii TaxID=9999 RepID=A0A8D2H4F6_UROPR